MEEQGLSYYKTVVKFKESVDGKSKKKTEEYLVEAFNPADINAIIVNEYEGRDEEIRTTMKISSVKEEAKYTSIIENGQGTFFDFTIELVDDSKESYLVECSDWDCSAKVLEDAVPNLGKVLKQEELKYLSVLRSVIVKDEAVTD